MHRWEVSNAHVTKMSLKRESYIRTWIREAGAGPLRSHLRKHLLGYWDAEGYAVASLLRAAQGDTRFEVADVPADISIY
jgi:hypothetical protein